MSGSCYCTGACDRGDRCPAYPHGKTEALEEEAARIRERGRRIEEHKDLIWRTYQHHKHGQAPKDMP